MRQPSTRALATAAALATVLIPAATSAQTRDETGGSFVARFDGGPLDESRWFVADGWVNGENFGCVFDPDALRTTEDGLVFEVVPTESEKRDYACAEVQSRDFYGHGIYEARLRSAEGEGLMSGFFTYTGPYFDDPHDEIDIELPGARPQTLETNLWVDGSDAEGATEVDLGFDATEAVHDYAFEWTPDAVRFYVDGRLVGEETDPARIPTTPSKIYLNLYNGRGGFDAWLGRFEPNGETPRMVVERVAYTAPGEPCQFPDSIACETTP